MTESIVDARIALPDLEMAIRHCGEGPLVLCLHGFPDSAQTWDALLPGLADAETFTRLIDHLLAQSAGG